MKYIRGFLMAWGCFCRIPCPYRKWNEDDRYAMLNMFPFVGLLLGDTDLYRLVSAEPAGNRGAPLGRHTDCAVFLDDGVHTSGRIHGLQRCCTFETSAGREAAYT